MFVNYLQSNSYFDLWSFFLSTACCTSNYNSLKEIPAPVLQTGNETVLFVDDEENIRNMGKAFLQRLGYRVLLARDGEEAAKQYETHKDEIAVVVLDMTMPNP